MRLQSLWWIGTKVGTSTAAARLSLCLLLLCSPPTNLQLVAGNKDGTIDEGEFISWALNCDVRGISNSEPSRVMALLRSPAMVYIPPKEQRDNLGKLQKPVLDRRSPAVQAHYGLTIEDIFEGGPDRVLRKLRLTEVVNYR